MEDKMKTISTKIMVLLAVLMSAACQPAEDYTRKEVIRVFTADQPDADMSVIQVSEQEDTIEVCIRASVDYKVSFSQSEEYAEQDWIQVSEVRYDEERQCGVVSVVVSRIENPLEERFGILTVSAPDYHLNRFVKLRQGHALEMETSLQLLEGQKRCCLPGS